MRYDGLPVNDYKGKTVTFGAWVYATTANNVLQIYDNTVGFVGSPYHSGIPRWEFLTVSRTISTSATMVLFDFYLSSDSITAYIDGAIATEGDERRKEMAYALNTDPEVWVVDRLSQEQVFGCEGGSVLEKSRTRNYYDRDAQGNRRAHGSAPTKGDLIAVERVHLTDGSKTTFTDYWYDGYGNVTTEQDGRGNQTNAVYEQTHHTFPATITNAKGQVEARQYDAATGKPTSVTDINGQVTAYEYDGYKRLTAVRKPGDATGTPTLEILYSVNTEPAAPRFAITTKQKDGSTGDGVLQSKTWYDGLGRAVQARSENVAGSNPIVVDTAFDGRGLQASQSVPYVQTGTLSDIWAYGTPDANQPKTSTAYEGLRRISQVTNPDGTNKRYFYPGRTTTIVDENSHQRDLREDALGRLVEVKEYTGAYPNATLYATTSYVYDALDNLLQTTDQAGHITKMEYNSLGQRVKLHDPDLCGSDAGQSSYWWTFEFDLAGNRARQTDAKGQAVSMVLDELNRPTRKHYPKGWVDDPLTTSHSPGVYDLMEIRAAVDVDRVAAGLNPDAVPWTNPAIVAGKDVTIRAVHFNEMRSRIQDLWTQASIGTVPGFTRGTIQVDPPRLISLQDPTDLRAWLVTASPNNYEGSAWACQNGRRARAVYRWDNYTDNGSRGYPKGRRTEMWDVSGRTRGQSSITDNRAIIALKNRGGLDKIHEPAEIAHKAVDAAADKLATDILMLDLREKCSFADYFVVCSGSSERQLKAILEEIDKALTQVGTPLLRREGTTESGWVLLDFGDVIVHIFTPELRDYYRIEKIWADGTPVVRVQ